MIIIKKIDDLKTVNEIIKIFDSYFKPKISDIVVDLDKYSEKIFSNAITIAIYDENTILGFASFYCNNLDTKIAFLAQISVKSEYESNGYGTMLLKECEKISKEKGMTRFKLEVYNDNISGIIFYKKNGYSYESICSVESKYMIKKL